MENSLSIKSPELIATSSQFTKDRCGGTVNKGITIPANQSSLIVRQNPTDTGLTKTHLYNAMVLARKLHFPNNHKKNHGNVFPAEEDRFSSLTNLNKAGQAFTNHHMEDSQRAKKRYCVI